MSSEDMEAGSAEGGMSTLGQGQDQGARPDQSSAKQMASEAAQAIKQEARSFAEAAKEKVADQAEQHKATATDALGEFANAIRRAGEELSNGEQSVTGRMVKHAADGLEGLSRSVSEKRPEELLSSLRQFGRENPTAFIAGSVLAGLALGRFMRSSEQHGQASGSQYAPAQNIGKPAGQATSLASDAGHPAQGSEPAAADDLSQSGDAYSPAVGGEPAVGGAMGTADFEPEGGRRAD